MDDLGRVVLPAVVKTFGWSAGTLLEIAMTDNEVVVIRAAKPFCRLCGITEAKLITIESGSICTDCLQTAVDNQ